MKIEFANEIHFYKLPLRCFVKRYTFLESNHWLPVIYFISCQGCFQLMQTISSSKYPWEICLYISLELLLHPRDAFLFISLLLILFHIVHVPMRLRQVWKYFIWNEEGAIHLFRCFCCFLCVFLNLPFPGKRFYNIQFLSFILHSFS